MKNILGPNRKRRLSGMCANLAQLLFGTALITYFFKEGAAPVRIMALVMFMTLFTLAVFTEPEEGEKI